MRKEKVRRKQLSLTLSQNTFDEIESKRGAVSRSRFIEQVIIEFFKEGLNIKTIEKRVEKLEDDSALVE